METVMGVDLRSTKHSVLNVCCLVTQSCPTLAIPWTVACQADFPGKNIAVGGHFLLQGIFLGQGSNLHLLHCQADSFPLSDPRSPVNVQ